MEISSRHHLRSDAITTVRTALSEGLGVGLDDADSFEKVELDDAAFDIGLLDGDPDVLFWNRGTDDPAERDDTSLASEPFLTVEGLNARSPTRNVVTVDAGAVSFVSDGADVMRPGIVEADDTIEEGDLVAIAEESHGKFLAVGRARVDGGDMVGDEGKVVDSVHHVGDDLFELTV